MLGRRGDGEREAGAKMCSESPKIIDSGGGGMKAKSLHPALAPRPPPGSLRPLRCGGQPGARLRAFREQLLPSAGEGEDARLPARNHSRVSGAVASPYRVLKGDVPVII